MNNLKTPWQIIADLSKELEESRKREQQLDREAMRYLSEIRRLKKLVNEPMHVIG
tara:strand:+ start:699 stop:863 length:165 start_codon:yes stop_codon:yes gene_type:complete